MILAAGVLAGMLFVLIPVAYCMYHLDRLLQPPNDQETHRV